MNENNNADNVTNKGHQNLEKFELPMIQKKIIQRSCRGPVSIKRIDPKGEYIVIENTCIKKPVVLTNWILRRRGVDVPINSFKFEKHFVLHPNRQVKIYAKDKGKTNVPHELMSESIKTWGVGTYAYTQLINHLNQEKASLLEKTEHYERELHINTATKTPTNGRKSKQNNINDLDFNDDFNTNSRNIEFYFERNIRP